MTNIIIPSSVEDRNKISKVVKEIDGALVRIEAERDFVNDALKDLADQVEIPTKVLRKLAVYYHKQNIQEVENEIDDVKSLYDLTMGQSYGIENA